ncbi:hypothetical protein Dimus_001574 [Dionaea muscipula]
MPAVPATSVVPATPSVPATPIVPVTPATLVHIATPIAPAHGSIAHASASATSDPISSSVGEIPGSPSSQPSSSSSGSSSLAQLFVGPGGHEVPVILDHTTSIMIVLYAHAYRLCAYHSFRTLYLDNDATEAFVIQLSLCSYYPERSIMLKYGMELNHPSELQYHAELERSRL